VQKYNELATQVLIAAMKREGVVSEKAIEALGEFGKQLKSDGDDFDSFNGVIGAAVGVGGGNSSDSVGSGNSGSVGRS
jgi:hypothetical protein